MERGKGGKQNCLQGGEKVLDLKKRKIIILWLVLCVLGIPFVPAVTEAKYVPKPFHKGDFVKTTANLNVRKNPGLHSKILWTAPKGKVGKIIGGPAYANGYIWWKVDWLNGKKGWSAQNWLVGINYCPIPKLFSKGDFVKTTERLKVRKHPGLTSKILWIAPKGKIGKIIGGPIYIDGYWWWRIDWQNGIRGWSAQNWLVKVPKKPGYLLHFDLNFRGSLSDAKHRKGDGKDEKEITVKPGQKLRLYIFYKEGNTKNPYVVRVYPSWNKNRFIANSDNNEQISEVGWEIGGGRWDVQKFKAPTKPGKYEIRVVYKKGKKAPTYYSYDRLLAKGYITVQDEPKPKPKQNNGRILQAKPELYAILAEAAKNKKYDCYRGVCYFKFDPVGKELKKKLPRKIRVDKNGKYITIEADGAYYGQCVDLVKALSGTPHISTKKWKQGEKVVGNKNLKPGTIIATFNKKGKYNHGHTAIFVSFCKDGFWVFDQNWRYDHKVAYHKITGSKANKYFVVKI